MQQDVALHIGNSLVLITLTNPQPPRSPCSTTKPSSGTTLSHHTGRKSSRRSKPDTELDFYLDYTCQKPKLKWNLTKFDYRQTQAENSLQLTCTSSSTATNKSSPIIGTTAPGPQTSSPHIHILSTPLPISPFPSPSQIPREEIPNTWNVSSVSSWNQIFLHSIHPITTAWTVLYPPLWLVPLNPVPQAHLSWYIGIPERSPFQQTTRIFVSAESTFVIAIAITPEPHLPHLESTSGTPILQSRTSRRSPLQPTIWPVHVTGEITQPQPRNKDISYPLTKEEDTDSVEPRTSLTEDPNPFPLPKFIGNQLHPHIPSQYQ